MVPILGTIDLILGKAGFTISDLEESHDEERSPHIGMRY
jgi:hypothetical protein